MHNSSSASSCGTSNPQPMPGNTSQPQPDQLPATTALQAQPLPATPQPALAASDAAPGMLQTAVTPPQPQAASVTAAPLLGVRAHRSAPDSGCDTQSENGDGRFGQAGPLFHSGHSPYPGVMGDQHDDGTSNWPTSSSAVLTENGNVALLQAANSGDVAIVRALLAMPGIDVHVSDQYKEPALLLAAGKGHAAIVHILLAMPGMDIHARNEFGATALLKAAAKGHETTVRALLSMPGIAIPAMDLDDIASDGCKQALRAHRLPTTQESSSVHSLLQAIFATHLRSSQASASTSADSASTAPLGDEEARKLDEICDQLRFGKCTAAEASGLLLSLLHLPRAAQSTAALSLAFGFCTGHFRTAGGALDSAIADVLKHTQLLQPYEHALNDLSSASANINLYRLNDMNLLGMAASAGDERMIRGLMRLGAYVNLPSPNGKTALAMAVANRQWGACAELVSLGALPTLPDASGYPVLYHIVQDFCSDQHASESLALLIRYLRVKGIPFDIPVENPDASLRGTHPTVMLNDLLASNAQSWIWYGRVVYGLKDHAPTTTAATPAPLPSTT